MLVFMPDMHFVELMSDSDDPRFASNVRGQGNAAEIYAAIVMSVGLFGTYTVDEARAFAGEVVEGSNFLIQIGDFPMRKELRLTKMGDSMEESL